MYFCRTFGGHRTHSKIWHCIALRMRITVFINIYSNIYNNIWFVDVIISFSDNTRVRIFFFSSEFNIRLYDKNSESDYFFPSTKIRIFFSATLGIGNQNIFFLGKNHKPPPPSFKLNGPSLISGEINMEVLCGTNYFLIFLHGWALHLISIQYMY